VRRFDVSRNTVRKGLEALTGKGLITTRVGIVSFVTFNGSMIDHGDAGPEQANMQLRI
jgi:GntR family transcriptional regulator